MAVLELGEPLASLWLFGWGVFRVSGSPGRAMNRDSLESHRN